MSFLTSPQKRTPSLHNKQQGASLIEVLVSVLLMSFGMLAMAGMQAYSLAAQKNAANRAIASALANELAEIIRLNPAGFGAGNYDIAMRTNNNPPAETECAPGQSNAFPTCTTPALLAASDITRFQARVRRELPLGGVELSRPGLSTTDADIWIMWEEGSVLVNTRTTNGSSVSAEMRSDNCSAGARALATLPRCFYMKVAL